MRFHYSKNISLFKKLNQKFLNKVHEKAARFDAVTFLRLITAMCRKSWGKQVEQVFLITGESAKHPHFLYAAYWSPQNRIQLVEKFSPSLLHTENNEEKNMFYIEETHQLFVKLPLSNKRALLETNVPGMLIIDFSNAFEWNQENQKKMESIRDVVSYGLNVRRIDFDEKIYRPFPEE